MTGDSHSPAPEGSAGTTAPGGCDISLYPLHSRSDPDYRQPSLKYTLPISQSVSVHWNAYYQSISQLVFTEVFVHIAVLINQSISLCWITHYSNQQGWEFAHWFSEQIAHFWWATSTICSWSLIFWWTTWAIRSHRSFLVSNLSDSLTLLIFLVSILSDLLTSLIKKYGMSKSL